MNDRFDDYENESGSGEAPAPEEETTAPAEPEAAAEPVSDASEPEAVPAPEAQARPEAQTPPPSWSDAGYIPAQDASAMPRNYTHYYNTPPKKEKPEKKSHRGAKITGVIAACLACAVLGGAVGGYAVPKLAQRFSPETEAVETARVAEGTIINVASPAASATPQISTSLVNGSGELSATDIYYNIAVNQTVAITTEITYTNVWGYTIPGAVKGSGFILSSDGYIMTNYHVIEDAVNGGYDIKVLLYDGTEYVATVVGYVAENDVAVLKINATGLSAVTIGDSDALRVGEAVYAVGNPLGELEFSMTSGRVSATDRDITTGDSGRRKTISMFQIDAPINSGNSGGPVFNSRGEVVGIATAKYSSTGVEGLGFAIPINDAVALAQDLINDGYVRGRAYIGVNVDNVTAAAAQYYGLVEGCIVTNVIENSAAQKAGLKVSDIIVSLGDHEVKTYNDLSSAKKDYHAGDTAEVRVYRSGEYVTLHITFDEEVPASTSATEENKDNQQQQQQQQSGASGTDPYEDFYSFFGGNPFGGFNPFG